MSKFKTDVVYKVTQEAKGKQLELGNLYFKNVPVTFAQVLKPGKKYNSEDTAYSLNLFIDADTKDKIDEIGLNKEFCEVGVTKIKKGQNRGKVKYELNEHNSPYEGMFATQFSRNTVKRNAEGEIVKELSPLKVVDAEGRPFTKEVGNGSICHVKLFAYRNTEDMLVVMLDTVVVLEHVPYVKDDNFFDDELGISIHVDKPESDSDKVLDDELSEGTSEERKPATKTATRSKTKKDEPVYEPDDFDDDVPF